MSTRKICRRAADGFSLIELLLVLTLSPVVFFAVYSNFSAGIRLWQRVQVDTPDEDAAIFVLKAQRDFADAAGSSAAVFDGDAERVRFMAGVQAPETLGGDHGIGQVRYFYDPRAKGIMREIRDYSQVYADKPGQTQMMLRRVRSLQFSYLVFDPLESDYVWQSSYKPSGDKPMLPVAVRLTYSLENVSGPSERTFFIPAGGAARQ